MKKNRQNPVSLYLGFSNNKNEQNKAIVFVVQQEVRIMTENRDNVQFIEMKLFDKMSNKNSQNSRQLRI